MLFQPAVIIPAGLNDVNIIVSWWLHVNYIQLNIFCFKTHNFRCFFCRFFIARTADSFKGIGGIKNKR